MVKFHSLALALSVLSVAAPLSAATLITNNDGIIIGANGVTVGGSQYNVRFVEGTCSQVFGSCSSSSFDFSDRSTALLAAQALESQVFVDSVTGLFDLRPQLTFGCSKPDGFQGFSCSTYIPYDYDPNLDFGAVAFFQNGEDDDPISFANEGAGDFDFSGFSGVDTSRRFQQVWARFSPSAVPEPQSWVMLIFGFGAIGSLLRTKKARLSDRAICKPAVA